MEGYGKVVDTDASTRGTLDHLIRTDPSSRFAQWRRADGTWVARNDVYVVGPAPAAPYPQMQQLTPGSHGAYAGAFGPEVGIGATLGDHYPPLDTVVLVKYAAGGKSLRNDFRPPSAGDTGSYFSGMVSEILAVMAGLPTAVAFAGQPILLEGFFWFQGWNDLGEPNGYGQLLQSLVADLRTELGAPLLPVVVSSTGNGYDGARETLVSEQEAGAVASSPAAFVETRQYLMAEADSPGGGLHHWHGNAESYLLIGEAMGEAMRTLLSSR